jgi:hypothetical protein
VRGWGFRVWGEGGGEGEVTDAGTEGMRLTYAEEELLCAFEASGSEEGVGTGLEHHGRAVRNR